MLLYEGLIYLLDRLQQIEMSSIYLTAVSMLNKSSS